MSQSTANPFVRRYTRTQAAAPIAAEPEFEPDSYETFDTYDTNDNGVESSVHPDDTHLHRPPAVTNSVHPGQPMAGPHGPTRPQAQFVTRVDAQLETRVKTQLDAQIRPESEPPMPRLTPEPQQDFVAAWEIRSLDVSPTVTELFYKTELVDDLASRLGTAVEGGLRSMLITSLKPGQGRSTVATGMALAAATRCKRVALVDADTGSPSLLGDLRMDATVGWVDAVRGSVPLEEAAIVALDDNVTLFPLLPINDDSPTIRAAEVISLLDRLADDFDLVLIDAAPSSDSKLAHYAAAADSAVIVRDAATTDDAAIDSFCRQLTDCGVKGIGLVENFV